MDIPHKADFYMHFSHKAVAVFVRDLRKMANAGQLNGANRHNKCNVLHLESYFEYGTAAKQSG